MPQRLNFTERGFGVRAGARLLRSRAHRRLAAASRATSTGTRSSASVGARWFHTGGIFCALSETTPLVAEEAMEAARATRHDHFLRPELPRVALEVDRRPGEGARGQPPARALRRRDDRQRGGLLAPRSASTSRASTSTLSELDPAELQDDDRARSSPRIRTCKRRRHDAARTRRRRRSTTGARSLGRRRVLRGAEREPTSKSTIASAAATRSRRG